MHWITQVLLLIMLVAIAAGLEGIENALKELIKLKNEELNHVRSQSHYRDAL